MPHQLRHRRRQWHFGKAIPAMFVSTTTRIIFGRNQHFQLSFTIVDCVRNRAYRARIGKAGSVELVARVGDHRSNTWRPVNHRDRREMRRHLYVARFRNSRSPLPGRAWSYWKYAQWHLNHTA
jgi:hypothetical protein